MHIMLDLETMGTRPDAAIAAIGAVKFGAGGLIPADKGGEFYMQVNLQSAVDAGAAMDANTVIWWMQQGEQARKKLTNETGHPIHHVFDEFYKWVSACDSLDGVWGNGANFDNAILIEAYKRANRTPPWKFWLDRCYRTVKNMVDFPIPSFEGVPHYALDDAKHQAKHLIAIHKEIRGQHGDAWVSFL